MVKQSRFPNTREAKGILMIAGRALADDQLGPHHDFARITVFAGGDDPLEKSFRGYHTQLAFGSAFQGRADRGCSTKFSAETRPRRRH